MDVEKGVWFTVVDMKSVDNLQYVFFMVMGYVWNMKADKFF